MKGGCEYLWLVIVVVLCYRRGELAEAAGGVPALYVFGDSLSDVGNNNYLQTSAKANHPPYGCDFPHGPTGRFSNAKNYVDFIADKLDLPSPAAYLSLSPEERSKTKTGVNYASGSCGILDETGKKTGSNCLSLNEQVVYFQKTVETDLVRQFASREEYKRNMTNSIFIVSSGSNDYINNYFLPNYYSTSRSYNPQAFAQLLVQKLSQTLERIYQLGGRKIVVFPASGTGCTPSIRAARGGQCDKDLNDIVEIYNVKLPQLVNQLQSDLSGSTILLADLTHLTKQFVPDPSSAGFKVFNKACCGTINDVGLCVEGGSLCPDRGDYLFFDNFHPTEKYYSLFADVAFTYTIQHLT